ncbi:hypothetical protein M885DRAFT_588153 [Pelagophyceae sp. CCMP2097]|nr:hypothetical protein M885DRAFT_588153 [Pelagophyceae sp. CCMP2097]
MAELIDKSRGMATEKSKRFGIVGNTMANGAGAGGGFGLNAASVTKVTHFAGKGGKTLDVPEIISKAWTSVLDDAQPATFIICKYSSCGKKLELTTTGTGGLKDFRAALPESEVAWCGLKCFGVDNRGSVLCKRPKYLFVQYSPSTASTMKRAKMGTHKGAVKEGITNCHMDVTVEDSVGDLDTAELVKKLQAATGAHKPNGYEFDAGEFIADDFYGLGIGANCRAETATSVK